MGVDVRVDVIREFKDTISVYHGWPYGWVVDRFHLREGCGIVSSENGSELVVKYIGLLDAITVIDSI